MSKAKSGSTATATHTIWKFPLRHNEWLSLRLPVDFSPAEAERLCTWLKTLGVPEQTALPLGLVAK